MSFDGIICIRCLTIPKTFGKDSVDLGCNKGSCIHVKKLSALVSKKHSMLNKEY